MPEFAPEVESFIEAVLERWDELYVINDYSTLCDKLYDLFHAETKAVVPAKTEAVFEGCINNLIILHKRVGGSVKKKHGYNEFHSPHSLVKPPGEADSFYRIYVNASTANVIVLGRILVAKVCLTGDAVYFKIASTAAAVDGRKDAIVIYLFGKEKAERIAGEIGEITGRRLTPTVPGMTKEVAPGVSIAVDPAMYSDMVSFGQSRVRPFATAIRCYRDSFANAGLLDHLSDEHMYEVFAHLLNGAFHAHGINPADPSAEGAVISKAKDVEAGSVMVRKADVLRAKRHVQMFSGV